jgi:O-antigen/teichoic acid export membrane protein
MAEITLYKDDEIEITSTTVVIGGTTIFLQNINSITVQQSAVSRSAWVFPVLGVFAFSYSLSQGVSAAIAGGFILLLTILYWWRSRGFSDLVFDTSSGRIRKLDRFQTAYLEQVRKMIIDAQGG